MPVIIPPAGVTAASFFVPIDVVSTGAPAAVLCDWIDPQTKDLKSIFAAPSPGIANYQHAFTVRQGTGASVTARGQLFWKIKKNDDTALQRCKDEVERISQPFIDAGYIRVDSVQAQNSRDDLGTDDMAAIVVNFWDIVFDQPGSLTLG